LSATLGKLCINFVLAFS